MGDMKPLLMELMIDEIEDKPLKRVKYYNIYLEGRSNRFILKPRIDVKYLNLLPYIRHIVEKYPDKSILKEVSTSYSFEKLYRLTIEKIVNELKTYDELNLFDEEYLDIAEIIFWEAVGLSRIAPLIHDDDVEEIYYDGRRLYVRHIKYGLIPTDIVLNRREIDALITQIELQKGVSIDYSRGLLESELESDQIHLRIIIDLDPIAIKGPYIVIRNLKRNIFTIPKLVEYGSLSEYAAALLLTSAWAKLNITITGEVYTGKTTLLNAIDQCYPKRYRKIYFEEAMESVDRRLEGSHQVFYRASIYSGKISKRDQVTFSLHRTPDIIIFGEVLTDDDIKTMFYSIACGLKGLQTIHSASIEGLVRRWIIHTGIDIEALKDLDILVHMRRNRFGWRYVDGIYELKIEDKVHIIKILGRNSEVNGVDDISYTSLYKKLLEFYGDAEFLDRVYKKFIKLVKIGEYKSFNRELNEMESLVFGGI